MAHGIFSPTGAQYIPHWALYKMAIHNRIAHIKYKKIMKKKNSEKLPNNYAFYLKINPNLEILQKTLSSFINCQSSFGVF